MSTGKRKCVICGTIYEYCPNCSADNDKPAWMASFHDENCKQIYRITSNYIGKAISKEEAKQQLQTCDLTQKDHFAPVILERINEIFQTEFEEQVKEVSEEKHDEENLDPNLKIQQMEDEPSEKSQPLVFDNKHKSSRSDKKKRRFE